MALGESNIYSFDDCCILNLCEIPIPPSHHFLTQNKDRICTKNNKKLKALLNALNDKRIYPYKFVPSHNFERKLFEVAETLIEDNNINVNFLPDTFRKETIDHLKFFYESLEDFKDIKKSENFSSVKSFFQANARPLKKSQKPKYSNIPEDDDCMILAGLAEHTSNGDVKKYLITSDEHFWGYRDLIDSKYNILIVEEWLCHKLI
ncbi:hypothetical protein KY347_01000 [Candidatus Woesearchaeota archaeon]|nr:hypothetical protein [Candidatus Woesearchaeota archaeon]